MQLPGARELRGPGMLTFAASTLGLQPPMCAAMAHMRVVAASPAESTATTTRPAPSPKPLGQVLADAGNKALGGGLPGAVQVPDPSYMTSKKRTRKFCGRG